MRPQWLDVHQAANLLVDRPRDAIRLTDLSVATAIAQHIGLIGSWRGTAGHGAILQEQIAQLALDPLPQLASDKTAWNNLAHKAREAGGLIRHRDAIDQWVATSQHFDPGRKTRGAYATPMPLARQLAKRAVEPFLAAPTKLRVVDPSAGAGALLIAVLDRLQPRLHTKSELLTAVYGMHGVELDQAARELCCLLLWLKAASAAPELPRIARNIAVDNALTRNWWDDNQPFDLLVMNPPWESLRHSVAELHPEAQIRMETLRRLEAKSEGARDLPALYTAQGTGDRNLFKAFVELAPHLVRPGGRLAALIPAAFASDLGLQDLRERYLSQLSLETWTSFENLRHYFPIDGRYKFGILVGQRSNQGTASLAVRSFASEASDVQKAHIQMDRQTLEQLGGPSRMIPEVRSRAEIRVLLRAMERGKPFFSGAPFGAIRYTREFDLTLDRGLFRRLEDLSWVQPLEGGNFHLAGEDTLVPLVEGRMVGQYDFFQKSWMSGSGRTAHWSLNNGRVLLACRPQYLVPPRTPDPCRIALCDVTSATNTRTVHATWVPALWSCGNTAPVLEFTSVHSALAGLAVLNSMIFDWIARRIVSGLHLNKFYLETLVWPSLDESSVEALSRAAGTLVTQNPRFKGLGPNAMPISEYALPRDYIDLHVLIESCVARGFGLTARMVEAVFSTDQTDRRGLWRHFHTDPHALAIAQRTRDSLVRATRQLANISH